MYANGSAGAVSGVPAMPPPSFNPFTPEPVLQSTMAKLNPPYNPALLSNGWPPLILAANPKAVIPGVSTNAVGKNYRVSHKIGMGSFGEIYLGVDIRTNERIAIKVENRTTKYPQLMEEYQVYRAVSKGVGVPSAIWCGSNSNVHIMVMELLGDSLETLYNQCGRKFSLKTITMLAIQLLNRIEHHHNHHYLHRDIKPDNFLMGPPASANAHILYMVDMGLCKKYRDDTNLHHIPYRENKKLIGTPRYASINTHLGIEQCRRDDLESIGYMLVYFFAGKLPWQGLKAKTKQEKYDKISQSKMQISVEQLCKGAPPAFQTYLQYCRQLRFTQKPDYKYLRSLFYDLFRANGWKDDCIYDWMPGKTESGGASTPAPVTAAAAAAAAQETINQANLLRQQQLMQQAGLSTPATPGTPAAAGSNYHSPAQQQQQVATQAMLTTMFQQQALMQQQQQQMAARGSFQLPATPRAQTPSATPTPDPTVELRRRITVLEQQLAEQRAVTAEWKALWDKGQATVTAQQRTIAQLRAQAAPPPSPKPTPTADVIPLASAASLKRRRTTVNGNNSNANNNGNANSNSNPPDDASSESSGYGPYTKVARKK